MKRWLHDDCWTMAAALHDLTGWPIMLIADESEGLAHAVVAHPEGGFLDARGRVDLATIRDTYELVNEQVVPGTREAMLFLSGATERRVATAKRWAKKHLKLEEIN